MSDDRAAISELVLTAMDVAWSDSEECSALPGLVADLLLMSDWLATKRAKWQAEALREAARELAQQGVEPWNRNSVAISTLHFRADHIEKGD